MSRGNTSASNARSDDTKLKYRKPMRKPADRERPRLQERLHPRDRPGRLVRGVHDGPRVECDRERRRPAPRPRHDARSARKRGVHGHERERPREDNRDLRPRSDRPDGGRALPRHGGAERNRDRPQEPIPDGPREEGGSERRPPVRRIPRRPGDARGRGRRGGRGARVTPERGRRAAGHQSGPARGRDPPARAVPETTQPRHLRLRHERTLDVRHPRTPDVQDVDADGRAPEERQREPEADPDPQIPTGRLQRGDGRDAERELRKGRLPNGGVTMSKRDPNSWMRAEYEALVAQSLDWRLRVLQGPSAPRSVVDGKNVIMLCSNNYLNLSNHPKVKRAAREAIKTHGAGSRSVRTIAGNMNLHEELERRIARFKRRDAALLFMSGFAGNAGLIPQLA